MEHRRSIPWRRALPLALMALALCAGCTSAFVPFNPAAAWVTRGSPASQRQPLAVVTDPATVMAADATDNAAVERAAAVARAEAAEGTVSTGGRIGEEDAFKLEGGGRTYPLSLVVGQDSIKTALLLAAVNKDLGGIVISGGRGTAKSVMARAVHRLLPPIERVEGSPYNVDPEQGQNIDTFMADEIAASVEAGEHASFDAALAAMPTEVIPAPFVQVRVSADDWLHFGANRVVPALFFVRRCGQPHPRSNRAELGSGYVTITRDRRTSAPRRTRGHEYREEACAIIQVLPPYAPLHRCR
jgi:hypothetical protein